MGGTVETAISGLPARGAWRTSCFIRPEVTDRRREALCQKQRQRAEPCVRGRRQDDHRDVARGVRGCAALDGQPL
jgi:hypothetical protein